MNEEDLTLLCLRFLDGACTPEERQALGRQVASDPAARALYRDLCRHAEWIRNASAETSIQARQPVIAFAAHHRRWRPAVMAAAAAVLALIGWWWIRDSVPDALTRPGLVAQGAESGSGTFFTYPFDGFPVLDSPEETRSPHEPLDVPSLGEPEARIVTIARRLNGLPPAPSLDL